MNANALATTADNLMSKIQIPDEVVTKYGWIILATPIITDLAKRVHSCHLCKTAMENGYDLSVDPNGGILNLTKQAAQPTR